MTLAQDILQTKSRTYRSVYKSKIAKRIAEDYIFPILDEVDAAFEGVLHKIGQQAVQALQHVLMSNSPSGRNYIVVEFNPDIPKYQGGRYSEIGEYSPSARGGPPLSTGSGGTYPSTGSLFETLDYRVEGRNLIIGQLQSNNTFASIVYFAGGKIFVLDTPGLTDKDPQYYGGVLDDPNRSSKYGQYRPWFRENMDEVILPKVKELVHQKMREAVRRATRKTSIRKAIVIKVQLKG